MYSSVFCIWVEKVPPSPQDEGRAWALVALIFSASAVFLIYPLRQRTRVGIDSSSAVDDCRGV
jgi:hypothetical protein